MRQKSHVITDEQSQVIAKTSHSSRSYNTQRHRTLYYTQPFTKARTAVPLLGEIFRSAATMMNNDERARPMQRSPLRSSTGHRVLSLSRSLSARNTALSARLIPTRSGNPLITLTFISRRLKGFPMRSTRARGETQKNRVASARPAGAGAAC